MGKIKSLRFCTVLGRKNCEENQEFARFAYGVYVFIFLGSKVAYIADIGEGKVRKIKDLSNRVE